MTKNVKKSGQPTKGTYRLLGPQSDMLAVKKNPRNLIFFAFFVKIYQIEKDKSRRTRKKLIYRIAMLNAARVQKTPSKSLAWMLVFFFQCERKA